MGNDEDRLIICAEKIGGLSKNDHRCPLASMKDASTHPGIGSSAIHLTTSQRTRRITEAIQAEGCPSHEWGSSPRSPFPYILFRLGAGVPFR